MKRLLLINLTLVIILPLLVGCSSQSEYEALQNYNLILQSENDSLKTEYAALQKSEEALISVNNQLQEQYLNLQSKLQQKQDELNQYELEKTQLNEEVTSLNSEISQWETNYNNLLAGTTQSPATLSNPTWSELKQFLESDNTDTIQYAANQFDCSGFAITLRDRSWRRGFKCAYVEVAFDEGAGHALNAFQTTDMGLVYIDNTEHDTIAYIKIGEIYGTIAMDGVKPQFLAKPDHLPEQPLTSLSLYSYNDSIFGYDYFNNYQDRKQFYLASSAAYNEAVQLFNQNMSSYSYEQMNSWYTNLALWDNDLGSSFFNSMGVVTAIEIYWN